MAQGRAVFLTGSTMGHVVRMTMTGATGITFVFIVDAANLFWVAQLDQPILVAAIGYAFAIQFFSVSVAIGMMVAATALVSRQIGSGDAPGARETATASIVLASCVQLFVALAIIAMRYPLLELAGAKGEVAHLAARYLAITLPSLTVMAVGMIASATLRADGDGKRAMFVTLTSGSSSLVVDPFLIVWFELGLDGAAFALIISRVVMMGMALQFAIGTHNLLARPNISAVRATAPDFARIAVPAIGTQLAAPAGNYLGTMFIAGFGDAAVAGWAVVNRLAVVAFGGIFSLAGAIGGIFGQNYGAGLWDRLTSTYRDALIFVVVYALFMWGVLVALTQPIANAFGLTPDAFEVFWAFTHYGAAGFVLVGALFVSNAAFNTLGRPGRSTIINWLRDTVFFWPAAVWFTDLWGAAGVIYAQTIVGACIGVFAAVWGWIFVSRLGRRYQPAVDLTARKGYRDANRYRRR